MQVILKKLEVNQTQTLLNRNKIMLKYFVSISNQGEDVGGKIKCNHRKIK